MSVTEKAAALFRSHAAGLIDFSLDELKINTANLPKVGDAITTGTIAVEIGDTGPMLSAAYTRKKLVLRQETETDYPEGQAAIVHEGVHAWADLSNHRSGLSLGSGGLPHGGGLPSGRESMPPASWPPHTISSTGTAST
jgi:hypothetical protein